MTDATHGALPVFDYLINTALRNRAIGVLLLVVLVAGGIWSALHLPIDAVPDISPALVAVLTDAPALGPQEVERFITIPVENGMNGIPKIDEVRSISQQGLSVVNLIFEEGTDIYWARARSTSGWPRSARRSPRGSASPRWARSRPGWARSSSSRSRTPRTTRTRSR